MQCNAGRSYRTAAWPPLVAWLSRTERSALPMGWAGRSRSARAALGSGASCHGAVINSIGRLPVCLACARSASGMERRSGLGPSGAVRRAAGRQGLYAL
jgi:hypothetical protein